jgi:hypothetical protein
MSIIQSGLILNLDAGNTSSYPGTGTIWTDLSGNGNNGTLINGPTFDSANNGSIVFDGVNKYVDLGNILDYTSGNFSFSYWVNFNSLATNQGGQGPIVIFKGNYRTNGYYDQISTTGNIIFVTNQSGVNQGTSTNSGVIAPGNWYNIAYSRNGSSVRIYLNGNDITQTSGTHINPLPSGNNFRLANYANGYIYGNFKLSNLLSYNRNLTATEVLQNYNTTKGRYPTTVQGSLILNLDARNINSYPRTGIIWTDLSSYTSIGLITNGPTFNSENGGSIVFDGVDDYVSLSGPKFFTTPNPNLSQAITTPTFDVAPWYPVYDNFAYEFVCKPTSEATIVGQSTTGTPGTSGQRYITNANKSTDGQNNGNFVISVGTNVIQVFDHGDGYMPCLLSYTVNISSTVHIVITVVNKQPSLYINGVFIKNGLASPKTKVELSARGVTVNTSVYGRFSGNISIYRYYNRALSSQEILQNYNDTIAQSCLILNLDAGNTSSYPGTGTVWADLSGNGNNGTLINGPTFDSANNGSITFSNTSNQSVSGTVILSPSFTVEVIFMPITMGDYSPVFTVGLNNGSGSWGDFVLHTTATGAIYCGTDIATRLTPSDTGCGPGTFLVNNIYHMTFTFSDGIGSLYKNGVLLKSKAMTKPLNGSTPGPYRIQNISGFASSMRVYDFRIHCKALTSEEVQQNYKPTTPDCEIIAGGTEVFPNSGTTTFTVLYESTCAGGAVSDGPTTGTTITKVGKNGVDKYLITAIPSKGSIFKGWNQNKQTTGLITKRYVIASTQLSVNFMISDNTTWFAIFVKDCSYIDIPFCFSTNKDNLCLSCNEQKTVYFNNINNQFINNGSNINAPTIWFSSANFESLITYEMVSNNIRQPFKFNFSSAGVAGAGTFTDVSLGSFWTGICDCCRNNISWKKLSLSCEPSNKNISYTIFLYTNGVKTNTFVRTGDSYISVIYYDSNPNQYNNTYKMTYLVNSAMTIKFFATMQSSFHFSDCFGGGDNSYSSGVYMRSQNNAGSYTTDGYYTQLINGEYSNYNIIYRVYEGQVIQVLDCRSDILDCNG